MAILAFRNEAQAALFKNEISGQLSDGFWENSSPRDHYKSWNVAEVTVDPNNVGRAFHVRKDNYNLANKDLLDIVGDRMIEEVIATTGKPYDMKQLKADLTDMKKIFKTYRA